LGIKDNTGNQKMELDIREFLLRFSPDELVERGVLRTIDLFLQGQSAQPLVALMKEHGTTRLYARERDWYLNADGTWSNPGSQSRTGGTSGDLGNLRGIFNNQNNHINPFWGKSKPPESDEPDFALEPSSEANEIRFSLERDLQRALRDNIKQLGDDLVIADGGSEKTVDAGRIDITAQDSNDNIVVIELKPGLAQPADVTQLLAYMGTIQNPEGREVRGILVANDFGPRVVYAAKAVPNLSLKAYSFQFSFQDR
jgi:hypothetical protein